VTDDLFDDLYSLHDPLGNRPYRGSIDANAPDLRRLSRAESRAKRTARVGWGMGSADPSDVVWTLDAHPILISRRVVEILKREKLTGWSTYKAQVHAKDGKLVKGYCGLAITGRCDPPDLSRSTVVLKRYPGSLSPVLVGTLFDPDSWDGSDFFMPRPDKKGSWSLDRFVTGRAMRVLKRAKVSNLKYHALSTEVTDVEVFRYGVSYRLPRDLKKRVAAARRRKHIINYRLHSFDIRRLR
jgi:hypothetical protein